MEVPTLEAYLEAVAAGVVAASCTSGSWDGSASRFTDEQYARSCVLDRADCSAEWREKPAKQRFSLPIREPGGAVNTTAVSAAKGRLGQTNACSEAKAKASSRLDRAASACGMNKEKTMENEDGRIVASTNDLRATGGFVPTTTTGDTVTFQPNPPFVPPAGEGVMGATEKPRSLDARVVGEMATIAGRPWCLKPESMDVLVSAFDGSIHAHELIEEIPQPRAEKYGQIAVIPLQGLITPAGGGGILGALLGIGGGLSQFRQDLREAVADPDVHQVILKIDSPGGLVDQVPETAAAVRAARERKPITAVASTQAASAAYWIGSQADRFVVTPSGEVGSIGVYMMHTDKSEALANDGLHITLTSAGKYKTEGNAYEPLSDSAKEAKQRKVDQVYQQFVADVAEGRRANAADVREGYGEGRTLLANDAVEQGLADKVGTFEGVVEGAVSEVRDAVSREKVTTRALAAQRAEVMFG